MADADELYTLKQAFYVGNYQEVLDEADTLMLKTEPQRLEKDYFVARARIGLGQASAVAASIRDDAPAPLVAVKLLAAYQQAAGASAAVAGVLSRVDALLLSAESAAAGGAAPAVASAALVQAVAAVVFLAEGQYERALKAVRSGATQELLALAAQTYLRLDRPDLAEGSLRALQERDDESSLYQLCAAQLYVSVGGRRGKEAALLYREVLDRYGAEAVPALNGIAVAHMACRRWSEAERALEEALSKDASHPDTLANLVACAQHTGKGGAEATLRALATLKRVAPHHPCVEAAAMAEAAFDRLAASYAS